MAKRTKVLVVDDNESFLDMLFLYLIDNGYEVIKSLNGKDALSQYSTYAPDIIITDIIMPETDGIELLINLRKINPDVKVIVMSGGNKGYADAYLQMAKKLGANCTINKPFELIDLLKKIKNLEI
jgi:CheY-like chemotaxis protein